MVARLPLVLGPTGLPEQLQPGDTLSGVAGSGTMTSVTLTLPSFLNVAPATITTAGTFAVTLAAQAPNVVLAGPTSGGSATPTFRALAAADLPAATTLARGGVRPDGTTITISGDVISAPGGGAGLVNNSTTITGGAANRLLYDDGTKLQEAIVGSGLSLAAGTLSATGGGGASNLINLATAYGLVADGNTATPTDNATAFLRMMGVTGGAGSTGLVGIKTLNPVYGQAIPVSINTGTGVVTTFTNSGRGTPLPHMCRVTDPVVFFIGSGGTMPGGITSMVPVFVANDSITATTLKVQALDPFAIFCSGDIGGSTSNPTITFSGSPSNVYMATVNADWVNLWLPAGTYYSTGLFRLAGPRKVRLYADGTTIIGPCSFGIAGAGFFGGFYPYAGYEIKSVLPGSNSVELKTAADAANVTVGGWIGVGAIDTQNTFTPDAGSRPQSTPSNLYNFEYVPVLGKSGAVITLGTTTGLGATLRNGYLDTYPEYYRDNPFSNSHTIPAGRARLYPVGPAWDAETYARGLHISWFNQTQVSGRKPTLENVTGGGEAIFFTGCMEGRFINVKAGDGFGWDGSSYRVTDQPQLLFDKLNSRASIESCVCQSISVEGSGPDLMNITNTQVQSLGGTAKNTVISGSDILNMSLGFLGFGGSSDTIAITGGSRIGSMQIVTRFDNDANPGFGGRFSNMCLNFSFSGGLLTQPKPPNFQNNSWLIPGKRGFINDMAGNFPYMGADFVIGNVYGGQAAQNASATVGPASPPTLGDATVNSIAGVANGDIIEIDGLVPSGGQLNPIFPYRAVQVSGTSCKLAESLNGDPVQVSGAAVTTTVNRNPNWNISTSLTSIPAGASASHTVTASVASPSVFDWGVAAPANGTPIALQTTGVLPVTDLVRHSFTGTLSGNTLSGGPVGGMIFYPLALVGAGVPDGTQVTGPKNAGAGTYFINPSASVGPVAMTANDPMRTNILYTTANGAANHFNLFDPVRSINVIIVKNGLGTHTAISNPLKFAPNLCPSLTVIGSTGCAAIEDARNAPTQGRPFLTFGSRTMLGGMPSNPVLLGKPINVQGKLKQMIVNVAVADTSGGGAKTLVLTAIGFDATLNRSDFSATINLATVGQRIISQSAPVGSQSGDSLPTYIGTISSQVQMATTVGAGGQPTSSYAQVYVSVETDQGIWATPSVSYFADPVWGGTVLNAVDSTMPGVGDNVSGI